MTQDHGLGERVYHDLKQRVLFGQLPPHIKVDFASLADELHVSTTPVREAAMRLLGEGLLDSHPKGGARPVTVSEHRLRALLELHGRLAVAAVDWSAAPIKDSPARDTTYEAATRLYFRALAQSVANTEFVDVMERIADRLAPFRQREVNALPQAIADLQTLRDASSDPGRLRRALRSYHRRRIGAVAQIVWLTNSSST